MRRGPPSCVIGLAACPNCHDDRLQVATNKRGYPAAYCRHCDTQIQPRADAGSLLLLGRIHEWSNPDAAAAMIEAADLPAMAPARPATAPKPPPHLAPAALRSRQPPAPKRRSILDAEL